MSVYYIIAKNGQKYYYKDKERITVKEGKRLGAKKYSGVKSISRRKSRVPCKSYQYRNPVTGRCKNKPSHKKKKPITPKSVSNDRWKWKQQTKSDCIKRSKLSLRDLQIKVVQYMDEHNGLLVVHGTGCGKTLTAVTTTQCYLDKYPERGVVFVGPASLISNFQKEMKSYGIENDERYEFYSYDKFMSEYKAGRPISLKNKFLVVDEAHNLRNPKSKKTEIIVKASIKSDKRLLLTATPFVNSLTDFIPLINMIYGKMKVGTRKQFYEGKVEEWLGKKINDENLRKFRNLLEDKVDVEDCKNPEDFPERIDHVIEVPMTLEYYKRYARLVRGENVFDILFAKPSMFYNGYRRAVNKAGSEYFSSKIERALPILKKGHAIIYTNWIDFGILPITKTLRKHNVTFKTFFGDVPKQERQGIVDAFNRDEFDVLILTKAGGEGIDLKGVRSVVVLDPTWNDAGLQQVIGRAIRYKSHAHLPPNQRNVNVYLMKLVVPQPTPRLTDISNVPPSGDMLLYEIVERKNEISSILNLLLKELSI